MVSAAGGILAGLRSAAGATVRPKMVGAAGIEPLSAEDDQAPTMLTDTNRRVRISKAVKQLWHRCAPTLEE